MPISRLQSFTNVVIFFFFYIRIAYEKGLRALDAKNVIQRAEKKQHFLTFIFETVQELLWWTIWTRKQLLWAPTDKEIMRGYQGEKGAANCVLECCFTKKMRWLTKMQQFFEDLFRTLCRNFFFFNMQVFIVYVIDFIITFGSPQVHIAPFYLNKNNTVTLKYLINYNDNVLE